MGKTIAESYWVNYQTMSKKIGVKRFGAVLWSGVRRKWLVYGVHWRFKPGKTASGEILKRGADLRNMQFHWVRVLYLLSVF